MPQTGVEIRYATEEEFQTALRVILNEYGGVLQALADYDAGSDRRPLYDDPVEP